MCVISNPLVLGQLNLVYAREVTMFSACANPNCQAPFNYREGRFFRFHKHHPPSETPPNSHSVQHFWLCGVCCGGYTLEYRTGYGVLLKERPDKSHNLDTLRFIAAA
jgi:hypothetical protein